jgi:hypothetical protein
VSTIDGESNYLLGFPFVQSNSSSKTREEDLLHFSMRLALRNGGLWSSWRRQPHGCQTKELGCSTFRSLSLALIPRSAWNRNSANFAFWAFSEVRNAKQRASNTTKSPFGGCANPYKSATLYPLLILTLKSRGVEKCCCARSCLA